MTVFSSQLGL